MWEESRQPQPRHGAVAPHASPGPTAELAPSPCGRSRRRCGGCPGLLAAASSHLPPPSSLAASRGRQRGSPLPLPRPRCPRGQSAFRAGCRSPPGPAGPGARGPRAGSAACDTAGITGDTGALPAGEHGPARHGARRPLARLPRPAMPPRLTSGWPGRLSPGCKRDRGKAETTFLTLF